jgi:mannosyltransferase OCH1-like enzyme
MFRPLAYYLILFSNAVIIAEDEPWNYPLLNSDVILLLKKDNRQNETILPPKLIPRKIWVGTKEVPQNESFLPEDLQSMFTRARNDSWEVHILGNREQLELMEKYWSNTSVLWAFKTINPELGASLCDVWRLANLYIFGGLYLDSDSFIQKSLERIVGVNDSLIVTTEKNPYKDNCYISSNKLSYKSQFQKFGNYSGWKSMYGGKNLANWGIFAAPQHPAILEVLQNIVESIRNEYHRTPSIVLLNQEPRWLIITCITGPSMLTATLRVSGAENLFGLSRPNSIRVISNDFKEFGGSHYSPKKMKEKIGGLRYSEKLQKGNVYFLKSYVDFSIDRLEGKAISPGGKKIYFVENGTSHMFPNFDAFVAKKLVISDVVYIFNWTEFQSIPEGPILLAVHGRT